MNYHLLSRSLLLTIIMSAGLGACVTSKYTIQTQSASIQDKLVQLENSSGGRIGLFAINTKDNSETRYRAEERFPMCSSSKAMVVAAILKQSMTDSSLLRQRVFYSKKDVKNWGYAPITEKHINDGMTVEELCAASLQYSDNGVNLLLKKVGGPQGVTTFLRSIGDSTFRLDRWEPELNSAIPGDLRDTTTPGAMGISLKKVILGNTLGESQRKQLENWLKGNTTGGARIRAGVPNGWLVGDKTGTCSYGTTNDVGVIWPKTGAPIVIAIFFTQKEKNSAPRNDIISAVAQLVTQEIR